MCTCCQLEREWQLYITHLGLVEWVSLVEDLEGCWMEEEKQEQVFGDHLEVVKVERSLVTMVEKHEAKRYQ